MLKRGIEVLVGAVLVVAFVLTSQVAQSGADRRPRPTAAESGHRDRKAPEAAVERKTLPDEVAVASVPVVRSLVAHSSRRSPLASLSGACVMVSLAAWGLVESVVTDDQYAARKLLGWVIILASPGIGAFPLTLAVIRAALRNSRYRSVYGGRAYAILRTRTRGAGRSLRDPTVSGARQVECEGTST